MRKGVARSPRALRRCFNDIHAMVGPCPGRAMKRARAGRAPRAPRPPHASGTRVRLSRDLPEFGLRRGSAGQVCQQLHDGVAYQVEFVGGVPLTVNAFELELANSKPVVLRAKFSRNELLSIRRTAFGERMTVAAFAAIAVAELNARLWPIVELAHATLGREAGKHFLRNAGQRLLRHDEDIEDVAAELRSLAKGRAPTRSKPLPEGNDLP